MPIFAMKPLTGATPLASLFRCVEGLLVVHLELPSNRMFLAVRRKGEWVRGNNADRPLRQINLAYRFLLEVFHSGIRWIGEPNWWSI